MKKKILIIACTAAIVSCSQPRDEFAHNKVVGVLKKSISDFSGYEGVAWSPIDTLYSSLETDESYKKVKYTIDTLEGNLAADSSLLDTELKSKRKPTKKAKALSDELVRTNAQLDSLRPVLDSISKQFKHGIIGYSIVHSFGARDSTGVKILNTKEFFFDTAWTLQDVKDAKLKQP